MNGRIFVPAPAFMMQRDPNQSNIFVPNQPTKKVTTVLTNLQRRNVQTLKVDTPASLNIFQMAAQGEIFLLETELNKCQANIDVRDKKVCFRFLQYISILLGFYPTPMGKCEWSENGCRVTSMARCKCICTRSKWRNGSFVSCS